jgi:protein SCO1/2
MGLPFKLVTRQPTQHSPNLLSTGGNQPNARSMASRAAHDIGRRNRPTRRALRYSARMSSVACSRRVLLVSLAALGACRRAASVPDLGVVPAFSFVDQDRRVVDTQTLRGKVWVAAFMFSRCPTICPRITRKMVKLQNEAKEKNVPLRLVSISVDPENDTPEVLRDYANRFHADLKSWSFLTGDFAAIQKTAVDGFKLALEGRADAGASDFGILHGSHLVLVDRALHIRGYYRTDDDSELQRLLSDASTISS